MQRAERWTKPVIKWLDTCPTASSLFCILVTACSSQVSAQDLDIMHGTQLPVHTNRHISLIAVTPEVSLLTSHHNSRMLEMSCSSCILLTWMLQIPGGISTAPLCLSSRIKPLNLGRGLAQEQQISQQNLGLLTTLVTAGCFGSAA